MPVTILIPSYNPDEKLGEVMGSLVQAGFDDIICVNDGSREDCRVFFDELKAFPQVTLLEHEVNRGKGAALKTGFEYILHNRTDKSVITADGDNQHTALDIKRIADAAESNSEKLILGVRCFDGEDVPARSSLGNKMTSRMFGLFFGLEISDTQTGLRAIPYQSLEDMLCLEGERFEYETNVLLATKKLGLSIIEIPIKTVYIEENKTSHFRPVVDSLKIMKLMAKFCVSSIFSTIIDIFGYKMVYSILSAMPLSQRILAATVAARMVSSVTNYAINRNKIFKSSANIKRSMLRYYLLVGVIMLFSYVGVLGLSIVFGHSVWLKVAVDSALFLASFRIQQNWVFKE